MIENIKFISPDGHSPPLKHVIYERWVLLGDELWSSLPPIGWIGDKEVPPRDGLKFYRRPD